jgi:hypothetical protein
MHSKKCGRSARTVAHAKDCCCCCQVADVPDAFSLYCNPLLWPSQIERRMLYTCCTPMQSYHQAGCSRVAGLQHHCWQGEVAS